MIARLRTRDAVTMKLSRSKAYPLSEVRVLNLGGIWAGRLTSMLLADQGADVIEVNRPHRQSRPEDALLSRGKRSVTIDLKDPKAHAQVFKLAVESDIVIDNLGLGRAANFGLDYASVRKENERSIYISIPGFSASSTQAQTTAWEGTVAASAGVYSDLNSSASILGEDPIFTSVPMASAYGGVHAATAASLAYFHLLRTGEGQFIEVALADAVLSSMAPLAMRIDGQPEQFDLPRVDKVMKDLAFPIIRDLNRYLTDKHKSDLKNYLRQFARPQFGHHHCSDGRQVFINAADHVHQARACLQVLGLLDQLVAEGMIVGSPLDEGGDGNNISSSTRLSPFWAARLGVLMSARFLTRSANEWQDELQAAGVPCSVVRTTKEWLEQPVGHESGCVATLDDPEYGTVWQAGRFITVEGLKVRSPDLAPSRKVSAEISWHERSTAMRPIPVADNKTSRILEGIRVLDLSNIIAGPAAARTLAEFGADVVRIDPPASQAGPRMTMWYGIDVNQGKRAVIVDLKSHKGRDILKHLVQDADVVLHNVLDKSTIGIGISYEQLRDIKPDIIVCQVSAWGGANGGPWKDFPAFDPVLQAATGITSRYGSPDTPTLHGIASCVDYITGFSAASGIAQALVARELGHGGAYVRTSLAMGAQLVQFPFVARATSESRMPEEPSGQNAVGYGTHYASYLSSDGWIFLAFRKTDVNIVAVALDASNSTYAAFASAIAGKSMHDIELAIAAVPQASVVKINRLDSIAAEPHEEDTVAKTIDLAFGSLTLAYRADHPSGYPTALPVPSWFRLQKTPVRRLCPAPSPGQNTISVLVENGFSMPEIQTLVDDGIIRTGWNALQHYLPR